MDLSVKLVHDNNKSMNTFLHFQSKRGVTLIELLVVLSMIMLLIGLITVNVSNFYNNTSLEATSTVLINDIKSQQIKAMLGDTEGRISTDAYGVHFEIDKYILFHGFSYNPSDPSNFTVSLEGSLHFDTIMFPSSSIILTPLSGEIVGYSSSGDIVVLRDNITGKQKTFQVNRLGVISNIF